MCMDAVTMSDVCDEDTDLNTWLYNTMLCVFICMSFSLSVCVCVFVCVCERA